MIGLIVALSISAAGPLPTLDAPIHVRVTLSPAARDKLNRLRERIIVLADYSAEPNRAGARHVDQIGRVDLGDERVELSAGGGDGALTGAGVAGARLRWVRPATAEVNINVFSARLSGPDNLLDCDFYQDVLRLTPKPPIVLACRLIGEPGDTRAISSTGAPPIRP